MLWAIFMDSLNAPLVQTNAAKSMLAKIDFPREALIMSGILQTVFNSCIKIGLLIVVLLSFGIYPDWRLILFPLSVISLILAGTMVGLLVTPIGMLYTDVGKTIPLVMQFLMFITPVVFPMPTAGWAVKIFEYNPLSPLILTTRNWLTGFPSDYLGQFLIINLLAFFLFGRWLPDRLLPGCGRYRCRLLGRSLYLTRNLETAEHLLHLTGLR